MIKNGIQEFPASLKASTTPWRYALFNNAGSSVPTTQSGLIATGGPALNVEHRVTFIIDADNGSASLAINGIQVAMGRTTLFNSDTVKTFYFGDLSSGGTVNLDVRSLACGVA
jgi:hypothetical protein